MNDLKVFNQNNGSFVDLVRALGSLTGVKDIELSSHGNQIKEAIGEFNNYIFLLVDGMGSKLLDSLPGDAFLKNSKNKSELNSVFPSTTATAITSFATAEYPSVHGVTGWFMYLKEKDLSITPLLYSERFGGASFEEHNVDFDRIWFLEPLMNKMKCDTLAIMSNAFVNSPFSSYLRGNSKAYGYDCIKHAVDLTIKHIYEARGNTFTYVYLHEYDKVCHECGVASEEARDTLLEIDSEIKRLSEAISGNARIIITADHGLIDVKRENLITITKDDPLMSYLIAPPSGDCRFVTFYVKENMMENFAKDFNERFEKDILLLKISEVDEKGLFGPDKITEKVKGNFGNYVGICLGEKAFDYCETSENEGFPIGVHSGIFENETCIPLIIF